MRQTCVTTAPSCHVRARARRSPRSRPPPCHTCPCAAVSQWCIRARPHVHCAKDAKDALLLLAARTRDVLCCGGTAGQQPTPSRGSRTHLAGAPHRHHLSMLGNSRRHALARMACGDVERRGGQELGRATKELCERVGRDGLGGCRNCCNCSSGRAGARCGQTKHPAPWGGSHASGQAEQPPSLLLPHTPRSPRGVRGPAVKAKERGPGGRRGVLLLLSPH